MELRPYQAHALSALWDWFRRNPQGAPLLVLPTGAGKSVIIAEIARKVAEKGLDRRVLVLAHRKELLEQNYQKLVALWPWGAVGLYSAGLGQRDTTSQVVFAGVQSAYRKARDLGRFSLVVVDEAHLIPPSGEGMYRTLIDGLREANPDVRFCGLTATPYRLGSGLLTQGADALFTAVAYDAGIRDLIDQGYLAPLVSKSCRAQPDLTGVAVRGGEYVAEQAERAFNRLDLVEAALAEVVTLGAGRKSWLLFASGVSHAERIAAVLNRVGVRAGVVTGTTPPLFRAQVLADFKAGRLTALVNCDVLTTGFDHPGIDLIAVLRATKSAALWVQICLDTETEILTDNGWRSCDTMQDTDRIATFEMADGSIRFETPSDIIRRETVDGEYFVKVESRHLNFRITDQHDLVLAGRRATRWRKEKASEAARRKDIFEIPVAGTLNAPGSGLSDSELAFLGWFLSDGSLDRSNNAITISQAASSLQHGHIETALNGCGFRYSTRISKREEQLSEYAGLVRYQISFGDVRIPNGTGNKGWSRLADWISPDKAIGPVYDTLTRQELLILLDALNRGDGCKRRSFGGKKPWVSRTMSITCGLNRTMADRLQGLCVTRGIRCNMRLQDTSNWMLHISTGKTKATIRGTRRDDENNNARLLIDTENGHERVWCVSTPTGTIVTRRRGKVAIMGNCGRGCRTAEGKADCLVLDFGGNAFWFGPLDRLRITYRTNPVTGKQEGTVDATPVKLCPHCRSVAPIGARECPDCGTPFPEPQRIRHEARASTAPLLSSQIKPVEVEVFGTTYARHEKRDSPVPTLRADHTVAQLGDLPVSKVSEWVCLEHEGFALRKAKGWWLERTTDPTRDYPDSVKEGLDRAKAGELKAPKRLLIKQDGRYWRVEKVLEFHPDGQGVEDERDLLFEEHGVNI